MSERETFELVAFQDGNWWMVFVPELIQSTQSETTEEIEAMGRDLIATVLDVEPDSFDVEVTWHD